MWFQERCRHCGVCVSICPESAHHIDQTGHHEYHRERCVVCGQCVGTCPHRALQLNSCTMGIEKIKEIAAKDIPYYQNSGGGVTISGGEPLVQSLFVRELLAELQKLAIHTAVDTALNVSWDSVENLLDRVDLWLVDLKIMDPALHEQYTGASNSRILDNLARLSQLTKGEIIIRIPMIRDITATAENIIKTIGFMKTIDKIRYTELLPYHDFGETKSKSLDLNKSPLYLKRPDDETLDRFAAQFADAGFTVRLHGDTLMPGK
jgi:pyruvate formate lyase activating enzyme